MLKISIHRLWTLAFRRRLPHTAHMSNRTLNNNAARVLDALKRHFGLTDQVIADASNGAFTRSQIEARRAGRKTLDLDDLEALGETLHLPASVFLMEPNEAIRFVLDHTSDQDFPWSRCTRPRQPTLFDSSEHPIAA